MAYDRPSLDKFQSIVTAAYGSPVNPSQNNGVLSAHNPLDDKVLATLGPDQEVDIANVAWTEGVEHDDSKSPEGFNGWAPFTNSTEVEHKPTPAESAPTDSNGDNQDSSDDDGAAEGDLSSQPSDAADVETETDGANPDDKSGDNEATSSQESSVETKGLEELLPQVDNKDKNK